MNTVPAATFQTRVRNDALAGPNSAYVVDGKIEQQFVEAGFADNCPDDPFEVSDADTMLDYLKAR